VRISTPQNNAEKWGFKIVVWVESRYNFLGAGKVVCADSMIEAAYETAFANSASYLSHTISPYCKTSTGFTSSGRKITAWYILIVWII